MKKITLLLMGFFCCLSVLAGEITEEQALQKAQKVLKGKQLSKPQKARGRHAAKTENAYYVFNAEQNGGFVVIAGNDMMPEVLGYTEQGNLDLSKAPDNVKWLMDFYAEVEESLKSRPAYAPRRTASERSELIALMATEWDQAGLYQQHCPEINGEKTLTGCVATAMAQVVNFFQWPLNHVREAVGYVSNKDNKEKPQIELGNLPSRKFNWFNTMNSIN